MSEDMKVSADLAKEFGLTAEEYERILGIIGRDPSLCELGIYSAMWSEHCSYKSSRKWLGTLPTTGPQVIQGPGENAGIVDIGDGQAVAFKMESHNHPSYIEPYQGAATGVGGIMRDVFTMGARPVANMNALRFGEPDHEKTRHLVSGVVSGIGGYGNCMGVPTVGGETTFHKSYNGNILVNAMCVGLVDADKIFYCAAAGVGNPVVYVGSKTGRDGIHGATMASAEFDDGIEEKRPTVQVGDPFAEKLLLEACLELMAEDAIVAIQDMGAAGLTSSSVEMASKGEVGLHLNLDHAPIREDGMSAYEIMLSESQERMLMVLEKGKEDMARAIFEKWELDFAIIGEITDTNRLVIERHGKVECDLEVGPLADSAPIYDRPWVATPDRDVLDAGESPEAEELGDSLKRLLANPDVASRRWIWEQYDHMVMADTIVRPGSDAAVVRVHGTNKGLAITTDCVPRYCEASPKTGGAQAVAEAWRNITASGAKPLAVTDCLNFGSPERPEIMGQFVGCIEGMGDACRALDFPVVSGNVSLYNETNGIGVQPTPGIGGVGLINNLDNSATIAIKDEGESLYLVGETAGWLGSSLYAREFMGRENDMPPVVDLAVERKNGDFVRGLIEAGTTDTVHDLSDGGLAIALAEMAMAGGVGATIDTLPEGPLHAVLFGEDQARYVISLPGDEAKAVEAAAKDAGVSLTRLGKTGGEELTLANGLSISVESMSAIHEAWLPDFMQDA